jgi:hypothetical protein
VARKPKDKEVASKDISLAEFKAWLQGVEDMQPDNWAPSKEQWNRIREKIDLIIEGDYPIGRANAPRPAAQAPAIPLPARLPAAQPFVPVDQSSLAPVVNLPEKPGVPNPANLLQGNKLLTPNIDTSSGNYDSMFA